MIRPLTIFTLIFLGALNTKVAIAENTNPLSKEDKEMAFEMAERFGICAGHMKTAAWIAERAQRPEAQHTFENTYRGWYVAGAYLLLSTGVVPDWTKAQNFTKAIADNTSQAFKAKLESDFVNESENMDKSFDSNCSPLTYYQTSLVTEMRRNMAITSNKPAE